jgi:hypothetical protein
MGFRAGDIRTNKPLVLAMWTAGACECLRDLASVTAFGTLSCIQAKFKYGRSEIEIANT